MKDNQPLMTEDDMNKALDDGLSFDSASVAEIYGGGLVSDITDAVIDQITHGSHTPINITEAIKTMAICVRNDAEGWHYNQLEETE